MVDPEGGGALTLYGNNNTAHLKHCNFTNNTAGNRGGGSVFLSDLIGGEIHNCTFEGNTASIGGALCVNRGQLLVQNSLFQGNIATTKGGALLFNRTSVHISHSRLTGNTCPLAGAIFFDGQFQALYMSNSTISGSLQRMENQLMPTGTVYIKSAFTTQMRAVLFFDNIGGGGLVLEATSGEIHNCSFYRNSGNPAGAICALGYYSVVLIITNTSFVGKIALSGAALCFSNKRTIVQNSYFEGSVGSGIDVGFKPAFYISIGRTSMIDFRSSNNLFHRTPSKDSPSMESILWLDSQSQVIVPAELYFWETTYQLGTNETFPIDNNFLHNTSMPHVVVQNNVNWTAEFSQFASGWLNVFLAPN